MSKKNKQFIIRLLSTTMLMLYAFVFLGSDYLHEHHQNHFTKTESATKDNSCELCKDSPQKIFTYQNISFNFNQESIKVDYAKKTSEIAEKEFYCFNNKAPPAQA